MLHTYDTYLWLGVLDITIIDTIIQTNYNKDAYYYVTYDTYLGLRVLLDIGPGAGE
jgi:hypothetical protein